MNQPMSFVWNTEAASLAKKAGATGGISETGAYEGFIISNLREATRSQNMMNRSVGKNSKSGVKGIGWDKKSQKWRARCQTDGKRKDVGFFDSIEEAKNYLALYRGHAHGAFANDGGDAA